MGYLSRQPSTNDAASMTWAYGPQDPHDDMSALLNDLARWCAGCGRVTLYHHLAERRCPECRAAAQGQ
jgi:hypothetical protein